jgi:hypothetical protein
VCLTICRDVSAPKGFVIGQKMNDLGGLMVILAIVPEANDSQWNNLFKIDSELKTILSNGPILLIQLQLTVIKSQRHGRNES